MRGGPQEMPKSGARGMGGSGVATGAVEEVERGLAKYNPGRASATCHHTLHRHPPRGLGACPSGHALV